MLVSRLLVVSIKVLVVLDLHVPSDFIMKVYSTSRSRSHVHLLRIREAE